MYLKILSTYLLIVIMLQLPHDEVTFILQQKIKITSVSNLLKFAFLYFLFACSI